MKKYSIIKIKVYYLSIKLFYTFLNNQTFKIYISDFLSIFKGQTYLDNSLLTSNS